MSKLTQVVSGNGDFKEDEVETFIRENGIETAGLDYQVIAITGPQSSGKSTLMNVLFGTTFEEMDALTGRSQTTKGIWLAKSSKMAKPATLVLDLEGSDGRERGEDDNSFERQSSLFALAVADILLVNMWAKDVGREAGAGKPLLKTIFQVNLKLFQPAPGRQRTVLLFVFRDRTKTPLSRLIETWEEDLQQMWATIAKPEQYEQTSFADFFEVKYSSLPNYEDREEEFLAESVLLRRRFVEDGEDTLVREAEDKLPGHALAFSLKNIWEVIKDQRDLNLPAHKVMVANVRCKEIMDEQLASLAADQAWLMLREEAAVALVPDFGVRAAKLLSSCIAGYDEEARYFEPGVRTITREELVKAAHSLVKTAYGQQLVHLRAAALQRVKDLLAEGEGGGGEPEAFSDRALRSKLIGLQTFQEKAKGVLLEGFARDMQASHEQLEDEIDAYIDRLVQAKVAEVMDAGKKQVAANLTTPAMSLLDSCPPDLWPRFNRLLSTSVTKRSQVVMEALSGYGLPGGRLQELSSELDCYAKGRLASHMREAAHTALHRVKDRFTESFSRDEKSLPRRWGPREDIPAVMFRARHAAARVLAQLTVLRFSKQHQVQYDVIDRAVLSLAADKSSSTDEEESATSNGVHGDEFDIVSASEWPGLAPEVVLLQPQQCRQIWRQFSTESNFPVQQALDMQALNRAASNRMPPLWAVALILVLGFNEFLTVLYNPLWLLLLILLFLFARTVYTELDIDTELQAGLLPGVLAISHKFVPTVKEVTERTVQQLMRVAQNPAELQEAVAQRVGGVELTTRARSPERSASPSVASSPTAVHAVANGNVRKRIPHSASDEIQPAPASS